MKRLDKVNDLAGYDRLLNEIRQQSLHKPQRQPSLFKLVPPPEYADAAQTVRFIKGGDYQVTYNPEVDSRMNFKVYRTGQEVPHTAFRGAAAGKYILHGRDFKISLPARPAQGVERCRVVLEARVDGTLDLRSNSNLSAPRCEVVLRFQPAEDPKRAKTKKSTQPGKQEKVLGVFVASQRELIFNNDRGGFLFVVRRANRELTRIKPGEEAKLRAGEQLEFNVSGQIAPNLRKLAFSIEFTAAGAWIGPAWVMGRWVPTFDPYTPLPWTRYLARALDDEWHRLGSEQATLGYGTLTLDSQLHEAAQTFVSRKGRQLHEKLLKSQQICDKLPPQRVCDKLPPRVALSVISIPSGEVLALGGWPRMSSDYLWQHRDEEWLPSADWIEKSAPQQLRLRYGVEHNFVRGLLMGSSTKPLWASAVLAVHPNLDRRFRVTGPRGSESEVFGIDLGKLVKPWKLLHGSVGWEDFSNFLKVSDNRYQVRLGFLGLALRDGNNVMTDQGWSPSTKESMNGRDAWQRYPKFPSTIGFSKDRPTVMANLQGTELAQKLKEMYAIDIGIHDFRPHRLSFWTKNENDDRTIADSQLKGQKNKPVSLSWISPETVNFELNRVNNPRDYISLLLGGGTNLWSNVDFAAAFATCVTGQPTIAHLIKTPEQAQTNRRPFIALAKKLRPGLVAVTEAGGTGASLNPGALTSFKAMSNVRAYAKTGTLSTSPDERDTKRLVLALIKWKDEQQEEVQSGLVFSVVVERADPALEKQLGCKRSCNLAVLWMKEFLNAQQETIKRYLLSDATR